MRKRIAGMNNLRKIFLFPRKSVIGLYFLSLVLFMVEWFAALEKSGIFAIVYGQAKGFFDLIRCTSYNQIFIKNMLYSAHINRFCS